MQTDKTSNNSNKYTIPTSILKTFRKELSKPRSHIINLGSSTGTFSEIMKIAKIIPVFKKDDKLDCNNYRTVSLLPNLNKIFEKLMHHS